MEQSVVGQRRGSHGGGSWINNWTGQLNQTEATFPPQSTLVGHKKSQVQQ